MTAACVAGDFQVIEGPCIRVQVQGETAIAGFEFACAAARCGCAAITQFPGTLNALNGLGGDAIVKGVDHPANRIAAVQQGSGAAHYFNPFDVDRVQRHGVVIGQ